MSLEKIVEMTLWTAYLTGEYHPESLLILSEVEHGKTALVTEYTANAGIVAPHDLTAYGIVKSYAEGIQKKEIRHLICPEFVFPLQRKTETSNTFLAFLNGLIEEGISEIQTYATSFRFNNPLRAGVIACLARQEFEWRKHYWASIGFLSRFNIVSYSYSKTVLESIFESIFSEKRENNPINLKFKEGQVTLPVDFARLLKPIGQGILNNISTAHGKEREIRRIPGLRMQKHLQRLIKALALSEGRNIVSREDVETIRDLAKHMNLEYNAI